MPNSTFNKQNQYFKFEKENKNNVIKKSLHANQARRSTAAASVGVTCTTSKTKSLQLPRNVYQPPIRNVQRDYTAAAPRVQTRLTPMTALSTAAAKFIIKDATKPPTRSSRSTRTTPNQSPTRPTISSICKQRQPHNVNTTVAPRKKTIKNVISPIAAANKLHMLLNSRGRSKTQPPAVFREMCDYTSKSRSQSSSPQRRISFKSVSNTTMDSYELAPLLEQNAEVEKAPPASPASPTSQIDSNVLAHSMEKILTKSNMKLTTEELQLLRLVVQSDERANALRHSDTQLFKDILRSQLQQIVAQETIVKRALNKLDNTQSAQFANVMRQLGIDEQLASDVEEYLPAVPLVEKEVQLLQTLSKRLEEKLMHKEPETEMRSVTTSVTNLKPITRKALEYAVHKPVPKYSAFETSTKGVKCQYGLAQEFQIAKRSLFELKQHASDSFYIPAEADLKCTTYAELQQEPELLLRYLKPKHTEGMNFNLLDQDPIFFKSYFMKKNDTLQLQQKCALKWHDVKKGFPLEELQLKMDMGSPRRMTVKPDEPVGVIDNRQKGGGENALGTHELSETEGQHMEPDALSIVLDKEMQPKKQTNEVPTPRTARNFLATLLSLASVERRTNHVGTVMTPKKSLPAAARRRLRRKAAAVARHNAGQLGAASHQMLKTILVGSVQLSLFLLLIMLFTYPEVSC